MLNIIIAGAPGSGKGTQSALIIEKFELKHYSTGEMLRKEIAAKTPIGIEADKHISHGNLVPDQMIIDVITQTLEQECPECNGIIFDGFPRTVVQAQALEELMAAQRQPVAAFIDLCVPREELIQRLLSRGNTSGRSDDKLSVIKKRLDVYEAKTAPVSDYYKKLGKYAPIEGTGTIDEIFTRIVAAINTFSTKEYIS